MSNRNDSTQPKKESVMKTAFDTLASAIERMESSIEGIGVRIVPILRPSPPQTEPEKQDIADQGQVVNQITGLTARIERNTDYLKDLIDRCTL